MSQLPTEDGVSTTNIFKRKINSIIQPPHKMSGQENELTCIRKRAFEDEDNHDSRVQGSLRKQPRSTTGSDKTNSSNSSSKTLVPLGGVELFHITVAAAKDSSSATVPTSELSFRSEISETDREAIDRNLKPWDSPSSTTADLEDLADDDVEGESLLRLPFSLDELDPQSEKKDQFTGSLDITDKIRPSKKAVITNLAPATAPPKEDNPKPDPLPSPSAPPTPLPARKGIWDISTTHTPPLILRPPTPRAPPQPLPFPSLLPSQPPPLPPVSSPPLDPPVTPTPFLPKEYISASGRGPINLIDASTGKILATRHPTGGYGYDPAVNWTPETSFSDGGSAARSETLVPIRPGSKVLVPRNRIPRDERFPYANWEALWGGPGVGGKADEGEDGEGEEEEDDDKTVVAADDNDDAKPSFTTQDSHMHGDVLVFRHEGDTSFTSPSTMPCSAAAHMLDIAGVKYEAEKLMAAHARSREVYERLADLLEKEVRRAVRRARGEVVRPVVRPVAEEIRKRVRVERWRAMEGEDGKEEGDGELEMKWADWFVDAAGRGVLHLKVEGCTCGPEPLWEERWW